MLKISGTQKVREFSDPSKLSKSLKLSELAEYSGNDGRMTAPMLRVKCTSRSKYTIESRAR